MKKLISAFVFSAFLIGTAQANLVGYATLTGQKSGVIKGSVTAKGHEGTIAILDYSYEVTSSRDPATGLATGKRQHTPLVIRKEVDSATPMILNMLTQNENLTAAKFEFFETSSTGVETATQVVELTNGSISDFQQAYGTVPSDIPSVVRDLETISFTFQKITFTDIKSGKTASDDWETPVGFIQ
jgi:type VI secretion system secreted protein Hcp